MGNCVPEPSRVSAESSADEPSVETISWIIARHVRQTTVIDQLGRVQAGLGLSGLQEAAEAILSLVHQAREKAS